MGGSPGMERAAQESWNSLSMPEKIAMTGNPSLDGVHSNFDDLGAILATELVVASGAGVVGYGLRGLRGVEAAKSGTTVIGEGMARVEAAAAKIPGSKILNDMPKFTGTAEQVTSKMMQYNRQWILNEMRSGRTILDIGLDVNRANPSIFYQMEQNMLKNYQILHPGSLIIK